MAGEVGRWVNKGKLVGRARRMEGQASGVVRMIEAERSCAEILQQVVALTSAAEELSVLLIQDHVLSRYEEGISRDEISEELAFLLRRVLRR